MKIKLDRIYVAFLKECWFFQSWIVYVIVAYAIGATLGKIGFIGTVLALADCWAELLVVCCLWHFLCREHVRCRELFEVRKAFRQSHWLGISAF